MDTLVDRYLALWNETDAARRAELLSQTLAKGAAYRDPLMAGTGHAEIDALVAAVHARFPGFRFVQRGRVDAVGDHLRFAWSLGPQDGPPVAGGTDFAHVEVGRFASVVGFLDPEVSG